MHTIHEEEIVGDVANEMPIINVALENQEENHHTSMVEVQGMIQNQCVSILIDSGASLIYVSPSIVEKCSLTLKFFKSLGWSN